MKTTLSLLLACVSLSVLGQSQLYVLNEGRFDWNNGVIAEAPSLGVIDLATSSYAQIASFDSIAFATDLEVQGEHGYVCLENTVMKVDLAAGSATLLTTAWYRTVFLFLAAAAFFLKSALSL